MKEDHYRTGGWKVHPPLRWVTNLSESRQMFYLVVDNLMVSLTT
jgi:hypothetical protein